jgi:hypothetical protein
MGLIKSRFIIRHRANNLTPNRANHKGFILRALSGIGSENSLGAHDIQLPGMRVFHTSMPLSSFLVSSSEGMAQMPRASTIISCVQRGYACLPGESRVALAISRSDLPPPSSSLLRRSVSECAHRWFPLPSCRDSGPPLLHLLVPPLPSARACSGEESATQPRMQPTSSLSPTPNPRLPACALRLQSP